MDAQGEVIMRTLIFAAGLSILICGTAAGADLARSRPRALLPAETSVYMGWSGFYLGVNGGGALAAGRSDFSIAGNPAFASIDNPLTGAIPLAPCVVL